ncbi:MAG: tol-pal system protein YbgF [Maricaulaceae bacterium]
MPMIIRFCLATCLMALTAMPSYAQSKKELAAQDAMILNRVMQLENRMLTGDPAAERLMQRMDSLEDSMRMLTGEVERLRYERDNLRAEVAALSGEIENLRAQSVRMNTHLDAVDMMGGNSSRLNDGAMTYQGETSTYSTETYSSSSADLGGLAGGTTSDPYFPSDGSVDPNQPSQVMGAPVMSEQIIGVQNYNTDNLPAEGQQKLAEGDFAGAQIAFKQYLQINPDAPDAGSVSYWLGESYFVKGGYADAADAYIASMRKAPDGDKAPDALVGLAATLRELGKKAEACGALDSLPSQYPNATTAVRNKARIVSSRTGC